MPLVSTPVTMDSILMAPATILSYNRIACKKCLLGVKCRRMQNHIFCGSGILDPFAHAPRMHFVLRCKCEFVLVLRIFGIFSLFVICFITKLCNIARFTAIETRPYALPRNWIVLCTLPLHHPCVFVLGLLLCTLPPCASNMLLLTPSSTYSSTSSLRQ